MKKLGKKLNSTNQTLKAYCGCACITGCSSKCTSTCSSAVAYSNLYNTSVANVYSAGTTSAK